MLVLLCFLELFGFQRKIEEGPRKAFFQILIFFAGLFFLVRVLDEVRWPKGPPFL